MRFQDYLTESRLGSKYKRQIIGFINNPPKGKKIIKVSDMDINIDIETLKDDVVSFTVDSDAFDIIDAIIGIVDSIKDRDVIVKKKGSNGNRTSFTIFKME